MVGDMRRRRTVMSDDVLFAAEGRPYSESTIKRYFPTAKVVAGITRRSRFHDRRHTFASTLASKGIDGFTPRSPRKFLRTAARLQKTSRL